MLRVAKNLKTSSDWKRHQGTVLALLKHCLELLDINKYPQVLISIVFLRLLNI